VRGRHGDEIYLSCQNGNLSDAIVLFPSALGGVAFVSVVIHQPRSLK